MEKQVALIVGAGALVAAAVGGLGWKTVKNRQESKKQSAEKMELRKAELRARLKPVEPVVTHHELTPENLRASGDSVLSAIADMIVEAPVVLTGETLSVESHDLIDQPETATTDEVVAAILASEPPKDVLTVIEGGKGKPILSIGRARVPVIVQPDQSPMFWSSFVDKLRRPEVIEMSSKDFETRNEELARGYHKCSVDGVSGVLHVTKSNVSAVLHMGGDEFTGISTSASRFNGKGLVNLNHEQAKNFLSGR